MFIAVLSAPEAVASDRIDDVWASITKIAQVPHSVACEFHFSGVNQCVVHLALFIEDLFYIETMRLQDQIAKMLGRKCAITMEKIIVSGGCPT